MNRPIAAFSAKPKSKFLVLPQNPAPRKILEISVPFRGVRPFSAEPILISYAVIGILGSRGRMLGGNKENFAIIPLTTGLNRYGRTWRTVSI